jgi:hypothetical protein
VRNLAGNPAFNGTSPGTTVIRTNLATEPRATTFTVPANGAGYKNVRWFGNAPAAGAYSLVTGAVDGPIPELTTYARKTWTASSTSSPGDTGFEHTSATNTNTNTGLPITGGQTYTFSSYLRSSAAGKTNANIGLFWHDAAGVWISSVVSTPVAMTAGAWLRVSFTATAPANAASVGIVSDVDSGTFWLAGDTLDGTGLLIEPGQVLNPWFCGATPALGDFTYNWLGTANASASEQRAQMVSTTSASRNTGAGFENSRFFIIQSTAEDGKKTAKWLTPAGTANSSWRVAQINGNSSVGWSYAPVKAGGTYTLFMRYRVSGWGAAQNFLINIADGTSLNAVVNNDVAQSLNTVGWQEYRRTFTALRDATGASVLYISLPTIPQTTTDGVFEIREWMLVEGEYTGDFIDGTKPFSKWDGVPNGNTSVGYPQQLTDLAGKPAVDLTGGASQVTTGGVAIPVGAFSARTIYLCYEAYDTAGNYPNFGSYGIASSKGLTFQTGPTGGTTLFPRFDFPGGSSNIGVTLTNGRKIARHVASFSLPAGLASVTSIIDGNADRTDALTPGTGWDDGRASLSGILPDGRGIRLFIYYAEHDRATRVAISRYLGNKYGANVA